MTSQEKPEQYAVGDLVNALDGLLPHGLVLGFQKTTNEFVVADLGYYIRYRIIDNDAGDGFTWVEVTDE